MPDCRHPAITMITVRDPEAPAYLVAFRCSACDEIFVGYDPATPVHSERMTFPNAGAFLGWLFDQEVVQN